MKPEIKGLVAAAWTPMHPDGSLNLDMVPPVVDHLVRSGISALFVCGSTGEGLLLTSAERRAIAEAYINAASGRLTVMVQVGGTSPAEARELAVHARLAGADAISALAPSYYKPGTPAVLATLLGQIASGAPDLPFYFYHLPSWTGVDLGMPEVMRLCQESVPSMAGVKFSSINLVEFQACLDEFGDRYNFLFGVDEICLTGLMMGARGAVGSTYNFFGAQYKNLIQLFEQGRLDEARRLQARLARLTTTIVRYRGHAGLKAVMKFIGLDCGPTRLPILPLDARELETLRGELESQGFFNLLASTPLPA